MAKVQIILTYLAALALAFWVLTPIILVTLSAFADPRDYYNVMKLLPSSFTLANIYELLFVLGTWRNVITSLAVAVLAILISMGLGVPAGYVLARYSFRGRDTLKLTIMGLRAFPLIVVAVPLTVIFMQVGIADSILGVALAHSILAIPIVIFMAYSTFAGIPTQIEEAAYIDGLDEFSAFLRVTLPVSAPGLAAIAIQVFIISWNETFIAGILTLRNRTLPPEILASILTAPDPYKFAGALIMMLPAVLFTFLLRKRLIAAWGITLR
ncbi:carbohydrate ABC transporter permease [Infirmifilum sp. NZ]|uniref:carbohydrate ABC transporter permease n=1 Tax=Infirmifilum sp. NZ TaxID=2926850 RepID=UPI0027A3BB1F|nr:carbohydrate ABC transporter permease [Infirmifilum sp. NZ]UNQ73725.1 carbohydrate ABC transporter permease [Infirmifilum sp. NZ]